MAGVTYTWSDDEFVAIGEAARILGVSVSTVRRWRDEGRLNSTRTQGGWHRFRVGDLRVLRDGLAKSA